MIITHHIFKKNIHSTFSNCYQRIKWNKRMKSFLWLRRETDGFCSFRNEKQTRLTEKKMNTCIIILLVVQMIFLMLARLNLTNSIDLLSSENKSLHHVVPLPPQWCRSTACSSSNSMNVTDRSWPCWPDPPVTARHFDYSLFRLHGQLG